MTTPFRRAGAALAAALAAGVLFQGAVPFWVQTSVRLLLAVSLIAFALDSQARRPSAALLLPLAFFLFLNDAWGYVASPFPHSAQRGALNAAGDLLVFLLFAVRGPGIESAAPRLFTWTAWGVALLCVPDAAALLAGQGGAPSGFLINANVLAAGLLLTAPAAVAAAWGGGENRGRGALLFFLLLLWWTGSRAAWAAAGFGALYFFCPERHRRIALPAAAALLAALFLTFLDADRLSWWKSAWAMSGAFGGVGPGAFGEAYPLYRVVPLGQNAVFAHSFLLESLAERGMLAAVAYFSFMGIALWRGFSTPGMSRMEKGAAAGLLAFLVHGTVHVGFSIPGLGWYFWAAAGCLWGRGAATEPLPRAGRAALCSIAGLLAFLSVKLYVADECLERAAAHMKKSDLGGAQASVERGLRWNFNEPELHSAAAALASARGDKESARLSARRAAALAPGSARFAAEAGEAEFQAGRLADAVADYENAVRLLPLNREYPRRLEELRAAQN